VIQVFAQWSRPQLTAIKRLEDFYKLEERVFHLFLGRPEHVEDANRVQRFLTTYLDEEASS
jgi:hypothetical protein